LIVLQGIGDPVRAPTIVGVTGIVVSYAELKAGETIVNGTETSVPPGCVVTQVGASARRRRQ
jgi:hypothetical protein